MIRVLIADDSALTRTVVKDLLARDTEIAVVAEVADGREAVDQVKVLKPDLVIMDVLMPVMDGLDAVSAIMADCPTPILILSANTDPEDSRSAFSAIRLGALDVMAKPSGVTTEAFDQIADQLIAKVKSLSKIRVIHHYRPQRRITPPSPPALPEGHRSILAIGASTGGPQAVMQLLKALPKTFPGTVLLVQHIAEGFAPGFADWLDREVKLPVRLASHEDALQPGTVLVAPNSVHLAVQGGRVALRDTPPQHNCRPAVDVLFQSLADDDRAAETVGVLLTGMGQDGAAGLKALYDRGCLTLVQDEASSAIFGMPKAAIKRGAASRVLPLNDIPEMVLSQFSPQ